MWVRTEVRLAPAPIRNMGVELRRTEIGVAEHLLDAAEVCAALQEVRREGVPEEMRMDELGLQPGRRGQPAQDEEGPTAREPAALCVQKELRAVPAVEVRPAACEVAAQRLHRLGAERDDPLLVSLADAADCAPVEVYAAALETDGLAHPEAGAVQELDERAVAEAPRRRAVCGVDQALDLAEGQRAGEAAAATRKVDLGGRVVGPLSERYQVAVEAARRGGPARDRAGRLPAGAEVGKPGFDLLRA